MLGSPALAAAPPPAQLPEGATIAGIAVGGLGPAAARSELRRQLEPMYERPIQARIHGRRTTLATRRLGQRIRYGHMVADAFAQAERGGRVLVRLERTISGRRLSAVVSALARPFYRSPRNARAKFGITHVARIPGRSGRSVDTRALRRDLLSELR